MNDDELEALLEELEASLTADVQAALALTAQDFAQALDDATELVAARFSVSRVGAMFKRRVSGIVTKLRGIARRGGQVAAEDVGEGLPDGWDDSLSTYVEATTALLNAVGDRLAAEAAQALADGLNAGEDVDELKARLAALFAQDGTQLGASRAERIAATEATRAWNAGTLAAAQAISGPDRPLVKQWHTRRDDRVRVQHRDTDGQLQLLDDPFDVAGTPMQYPGDPAAPADLTVNCRCILKLAGRPTEGNNVNEEVTAAADVHTGAMVALMPREEDAARLALDGGEAVDQLHLTLFYLGEAADWTDQQRGDLISRMAAAARYLKPVPARVFGGAQWNPTSDEPAWVWNVGNDHDGDGSSLEDAKYEVTYALEDGHNDPPIPQQYTPWSPHICAQYGSDNLAEALAAKVGPVTFDRIRVAFAGQYTDIPLSGAALETLADVDYIEPEPAVAVAEAPVIVSWTTPDPAALAFENRQTGDGRVFTPGALYWTDGPWPLQYADQMNGGHDGARLAGAIHGISRDGDRVPGFGVLYPMTSAGWEAASLLAEGAPLGVSVDLDDVDLQMVDATGDADAYVYRARLVTASLLPLADGGFLLEGETAPEATASGASVVIESRHVSFVVASDGTVPRAAFEMDAAAGDTDVTDGVVVDEQTSGDFLMRITRARVRGATLVSIPAYAEARIVLDDPSMFATAATVTAAAATTDYERVLRYVRKSVAPVTAADAAKYLKLPVTAVRRYLARAAKKGQAVRISRGTYTSPPETATATAVVDGDELTRGATELTAAATGDVDLAVAPRDTDWDGDAAASRVFEWADGDTDRISAAFAYRDDDADPTTKAAYKLGYADVVDGALTIIPKGVSAALGAMNGARGGVDLPQDQVDAVRDKLEAVQRHVDETLDDDDRDEMEASAWSALADLPPMPAAWFREPTAEELPPGGPGVNYSGGRIFGWVAQAGEPHAGFAKKVTIDKLGRIDTSHFLRQRFTLDDGSTVKAGAFTMNVGHHRDGAECETAACQFDSTRTVAGVVTVGMNERGMWFSGAAAPWLSEWDRQVFAACQPSYHMKKGPSGNWQLRAVLSVPVPGHSSPLLASAVAERAQLALTAAATMADVEEAVAAGEALQAAPHEAGEPVAAVASSIDYDRLADSLVAAMHRADAKKQAERAELESLLAEARKLDASTDGTEGI